MTLPQLGSFACLTFCTAIGASLPGLAYGDLFSETLRPAKYRHCEYEQFGYRPTYCAGSPPSFDKQGRPYIIVNYPFAQEEPPQSTVPGHFRELMICSEQGWRFVNLQTVLRNHFGDKGVLTSYSKKVEFVDGTDEMFLLVQYQMQSGKSYINTYDEVERKWMGKRYIGPSADDHGFPTVAMDSRGFLHVICGSHADVVYYTRSKQPNDASDFQPLMKIPGVAKATHLSFVCDHADTLHLFYRDNERDESGRGGLSYVRRIANGDWRSVKRVANSPQRGYCRMCNALSIDKRGRLFLNYGYFTLDYRKEGRVFGWCYPVLAYSRDGGSTWGLAPNDFGLGVPRRAK